MTTYICNNDGSRTINGNKYEHLDMLGCIAKWSVWEYYNVGGTLCISVETDAGILEVYVYESREHFESCICEPDPYNTTAQAVEILQRLGYLQIPE